MLNVVYSVYQSIQGIRERVLSALLRCTIFKELESFGLQL